MDFDLATYFQDMVALESEGVVLHTSISYENLPIFCSRCHSIGHIAKDYRLLVK